MKNATRKRYAWTSLLVTQERHKDIVPQEVLDRHSNDARFKRLLAGEAFGWTREGYDHSMKRKKPRGLYD